MRLRSVIVSAGVLLLGCGSADKPSGEPSASAPAGVPPAAVPGGAPVIVAPATGTEVAAGASVRVVVQADATRVLLVGPEVSAVDDAPPFEIDLVIPATAAGTFPIKAIGASASGAFAESNTVTLNVRSGATLQSMTIEPRSTIMFSGSTRSVSVLGTYSDGITRDITDPSTGTRYETNRPENATVSRDGVVTAGAPGTANVTAWNGPYNATVSIMVRPPEGP